MVEFQFLGPRFMMTRLFLTIVFVVIMGVFIEQIVELGNREQRNVAE